VTIRLAAVHMGGFLSARPARCLRLLVLGAALLSIAPSLLAGQAEARRENPLEREKYFYRQRAYPFAKIPPHA